MRLGAVFPQAEFRHLDPDELVAFVQRIEDAGYDHLLAFDHVLGADARARPGWSGFGLIEKFTNLDPTPA